MSAAWRTSGHKAQSTGTGWGAARHQRRLSARRGHLTPPFKSDDGRSEVFRYYCSKSASGISAFTASVPKQSAMAALRKCLTTLAVLQVRRPAPLASSGANRMVRQSNPQHGSAQPRPLVATWHGGTLCTYCPTALSALHVYRPAHVRRTTSR